VLICFRRDKCGGRAGGHQVRVTETAANTATTVRCLCIGQTSRPIAHSVTWPPANTLWDRQTAHHNFTLQAQHSLICLTPSALEYGGNSVHRNDGKHPSNYTAPHSKTDILSCAAVRTPNSYSAVLLHPQIGSTNRHSYEVCPNYE
jgi:hypothetical protein